MEKITKMVVQQSYLIVKNEENNKNKNKNYQEIKLTCNKR